ncbi:hypothetical protein I3679_007860 [Proteus mirabilis]|uniref:Uncharacterized protein n=1 Tax=Proteus mirabilis TaxID=584 RepID=A0ABD5LS95_PROMI
MKKYLFAVLATLFAFAPLAANAGCDEVVQDIQQKLKIMVFLRLTLP